MCEDDNDGGESETVRGVLQGEGNEGECEDKDEVER